MKNPLLKVRSWIRELPNRKHYIDFIAAFLTIPVLLTVLISNISNIQQKKNTVVIQPTPSAAPSSITPFETPANTPLTPPTVSSASPAAVCQKGIGPIQISYPNEGQIISDNPVCVTINYSSETYCSVVWSYSINNGSWSDYSNNAPCLYNMPSGNIKFDLRVRSLTSSDQTTLERNFIYKNNNNVSTPTPSATQTPSPTANLTPTSSPTPAQ